MGTLIRLTAVLTCTIVGLGFGMFAYDELEKGSKTQQDALSVELEGGSRAAVPATVGAEAHSGVRRWIDDTNDVLLAPFENLVDSRNVWVERGVPTLLGFLLYGVGLGLVANFLPKQARAGGDWRTA